MKSPRQLDVSRCAIGWYSIKEARPKCNHKPGTFGVQVLIWPPYETEGTSEAYIAFYGCRCTDEANFYLHGHVIDVTHWMPLPAPPKKERT